MILLEKHFDHNYVAKDPKVKPVDNVVEEKNIGTEETPRIIKLSKIFPIKEKKRIYQYDEDVQYGINFLLGSW